MSYDNFELDFLHDQDRDIDPAPATQEGGVV